MSRRLATVALVVRNYDEAIAWYCGRLGFVLVADTPLGDGKRWVLVEAGAGGARLLLAQAADATQGEAIGRQAGGRVGFFLETDDFSRDFTAYMAAGVTFLEPPRYESYGTVAVFADLYGNTWDLIEPKVAD